MSKTSICGIGSGRRRPAVNPQYSKIPVRGCFAPFGSAAGARRPVSRVLSPGETGGMAIHLGQPSPAASRDLPVRRRENPPGHARANRSTPAPFLFGLAPGEACRAAPVASRAVRSYRTLSPLPRPMRGGLLSAALSRGSPPPGVTRHRVSVEPGLSSPCRVSPLAGRGHPAVWPCQHRYPAGSGQGVRPTL